MSAKQGLIAPRLNQSLVPPPQVAAFVFSAHVSVSESIPKLTILSVINDLGSSMGLWLGVSLYTIFTGVKVGILC